MAKKLTLSPDEAVALTLKSGSPKVLFASGPKVIVWFALPMLKFCGTREGDDNRVRPCALKIDLKRGQFSRLEFTFQFTDLEENN